MLLIPCPWCGDRHESEFQCAGEAIRPRGEAMAAGLDDAAFRDWMMIRENRNGPHAELWWHVRGCGKWFTLRRDTRTHDILPPERTEGTET